MLGRKSLLFAAAFACLVIAFIAGGGSAATATQGANVTAGISNSETSATGLCNGSNFTCASSSDALVVATDTANGAGLSAYSDGNGGYGLYTSAQGSNSIGLSGNGRAYGAYLGATAAGSTGIYGSGVTYGVHGKSTDATGGWGVWGEGNDRGVYGISNNEGVVGFGSTVGVRAESPNIALRVNGKVELSRSGIALVLGTSVQPRSSINIGDVALSSKSMVLVTMQKNIAGVWVRAAVPNVAGNSVTIYLNKAVSKSVPVAWMVIERP